MKLSDALKTVIESQYGKLDAATHDAILDALINSPDMPIFSDEFARLIENTINDDSWLDDIAVPAASEEKIIIF